MRYRLFLDDVRHPSECVHYMHKRIGSKNPLYLEKWVIVRNYEEFVDYIEKNGLPQLVSFDHDLADIHYGLNPETGAWAEKFKYLEKTGLDCAKWLCDYCAEKELPLPDYFVHSMNEVGTINIKSYLENFKRHR